MQIIITGATSFVGAALTRELLRRGHTVTAVVRPLSMKLDAVIRGNEQALDEKRLFVVANDLSQPGRLPEKIPDGGDVFCHLGWGGSGSGARNDRALQEQNLADSLSTLRVASLLGCSRFLFTGSQAEYGFHTGTMTEESECRPRSLYGEAKLAMKKHGAAFSKALGITYLHARIFSAYGPGDHAWTLVAGCLDAFLNDKEIGLGACTQLWNYLYIDDLAKALCALIETPQERIGELSDPVFNVAGAETKPLREFVEEIHTLCGGRGTCRFGERAENAEGAVNLIPSIEKITRVTGWRPETDFKSGISRMIGLTNVK